MYNLKINKNSQLRFAIMITYVPTSGLSNTTFASNKNPPQRILVEDIG